MAETLSIPSIIEELIARFERNQTAYHAGQYNEAQVRQEFINPFWEALGWDVYNRRGYSERYKEVVHEDALKVQGKSEAPDYAFRLGGQRVFFVEAKKPAVRIKEEVSPAYQLRRYAWSAKLPLSVLTDFEEFAVYDCRVRPDRADKAATARVMYMTYQEYPARWDEIAGLLAPEAIRQGALDRYVASAGAMRGTAEVDAAFLAEIERWREVLARNIALRNPGLSVRQLNYAVQMTIDRLIFLRICEDRGIEPYHRLGDAAAGKGVYERLGLLFRQADERYDSGLFYFRPEAGRDESPDEFTLGLQIDDRVLKEIVGGLYYPDCPYEFSVLPADILGQVYERFLGRVVRLTPSGRARVEEKPEVKKAGGVYYTPTYIVDTIVRHTVGHLLEGKVPRQVWGSVRTPPLRVLDAACGSGTFLLQAYQYLLDWYLEQYVAEDPEVHARQGRLAPVPPPGARVLPVPHSGRGGQEWRLTAGECRRILLAHIYGVDIDPQAVEVTKLSLLLKVLEGEEGAQQLALFGQERALPDLAHNIRCGNALIGPDYYQGRQLAFLDDDEVYRVNAFDWQEGFAQAMADGGFDVVIGNPPYVFTRNQGIDELQKIYFYSHYEHQSRQLNTFGIFVERCYHLMRPNGVLGFITPSNWLTITSFKPLRQFILERSGDVRIVNILDRVFKASVDTAIVVCAKKSPTRLTVAEIENKREAFSETVDVSSVRPPDYVIQISLFKDGQSREILEKIDSSSGPLSTFCIVSTGLKAYQRGKGKPPQTDKHKQGRVFHSCHREDDTYGRYLQGADVCRYHLLWSGEYLSYGDWLAEPRRSVPFSGPRLLVRQIPSKPPYLVHGVFTDEPFYNDINSMIVFSPKLKISLKFLLGFVNSRLVSFWFSRKFDKLQRRIFPQFKVRELSTFPVSSIDLDDPADAARHDQMVGLVEHMLALHQKLAAAKTPQEKRMLEQQIAITDREIDRLVYALFGLTEDEIAIVEGEGGR